MTERLEILLPVHNEAASIESTIEEMHRVISPLVPASFIVCEDGSSDGTAEVLRNMARRIPMHLISGPERKGYSRAVLDGMRALRADWLLCLDSDGQCDPADFAGFWPVRDPRTLVIGYRVERADHWARKAMSGSFKLAYRWLLGVSLRDPSCPYLLVHREAVRELLPHLGLMQQGFWWEFAARARQAGFRFHEIPVNHRLRSAGVTQVYRARKIPGIAWRHIAALFSIRSNPLTPAS